MSLATCASTPDETPPAGGVVTVNYWAGARAASGVPSDVLAVEAPISLAEVLARVIALHPEGRLERVLGICSVLVEDRPASLVAAESVRVAAGDSVEFLPPFAGG
jgi:molybdopterin converting factor small subunit